jgi:HPt (histidine-containing phosphotransfer) domain-containing protein
VIHDRLKELGELFVQRTREELLLLNREVTAARQGNPESLLIMQRVAHRISGSGAMLGFKTISDTAAQIERILRRADPVPTAAEWTIITAQLQQLQTGLDQQPTATDAS